MATKVFISGMACLSGYGLHLEDLCNGLASHSSFRDISPLGRGLSSVSCGLIPEFKDALAPYAKPLARRKMSRLSKMAVTAAGDALAASGLGDQEKADCGVVLGTAFGSTAQSDLFYGDFLSKGALKVNPGYFPETVPNAPAGQVSIIFGLQGANTTVCQQSLSSEYALAMAFDLLETGMAQRMVVVGVEEMSPALLGGLQACGHLQKGSLSSVDEISLGRRIKVGEASVALVLETAESLASRNGTALARLYDVTTAGAASWPAVYHDVVPAVKEMLSWLDEEHLPNIGAVIAGASFLKEVDNNHLVALAENLTPQVPCLLPEYGTGSVMGAGLLRTALAVKLVSGGQLPCRTLGKHLNDRMLYSDFYRDVVGPVDLALASAVSPGGGAGGVLVGRV